ncbi:MAG: winged helix-turn-helix domain-containing protein [Deltaproteobacteria bacterium]|nr:MAG: winged helix-turn-helix domain-containing protein [Deltaproteobacteria bacterium]
MLPLWSCTSLYWVRSMAWTVERLVPTPSAVMSFDMSKAMSKAQAATAIKNAAPRTLRTVRFIWFFLMGRGPMEPRKGHERQGAWYARGTHMQKGPARIGAPAIACFTSLEQLMDLVKGTAEESFDRSIDVHVSHLRQKLGDDPRNPRMLKTVRGIGYMLARA